MIALIVHLIGAIVFILILTVSGKMKEIKYDWEHPTYVAPDNISPFGAVVVSFICWELIVILLICIAISNFINGLNW